MWFPFFVNRLRVVPGTTAMRVCRRLGRCWEMSCALPGKSGFSSAASKRSAGADASRSRRNPRKGRDRYVCLVEADRIELTPLMGWLVHSELLLLFGAAFSPPGRGKGRIPAVQELRSTRLPANRHTMLISQSRFRVTALGCRSEKCSREDP